MEIGLVNDKVKTSYFFLHYALSVAIKYNVAIQKDLFFRVKDQVFWLKTGLFSCARLTFLRARESALL